METRPQTILIIENAPSDDEEFRLILAKDFQLLFANGSKDVLEMAGQNDIDLVLLDNDALGIEADEICSHLLENTANRNTPIILMVKKEQGSNLEDLLPVGVADCIDKPLQPPIVMARLQRHLELKGYRDRWKGATMDDSSVIGSQNEFDFLLDREWKRALRSQTPISLIIIDVDFFDEYEAHEGQAACINCLHSVGEVLRICVKRDLDFIAYYEMHKIVCLLPDTDADGARRVCQLIKVKVAQLNIPHPCSPIAAHVTLSIGAATVRPTFKLNQDHFVRQVEISLEEARNNTHNQVRW